MNEKIIKIKDEFIEEALSYARLSKNHLSNQHSFHNGSLDDKEFKMFQGKLGEKIFKQYMIDNDISFVEDESHHTKADEFDFCISKYLIDVKTRTKEYHTRTLEMVKQFQIKPKDIYVSVKLNMENFEGYIIGWFCKKDIIRINRIENNGYLDNYVLYDKELRDIDTLKSSIRKKLNEKNLESNGTLYSSERLF